MGLVAAVNNVVVTGYSEGEYLMTETFDDCALPNGWSTYLEEGENNWEIGFVPNGNLSYANNNIDGTCLAYFDDDGYGEEAPFSRAYLLSESIDATEYAYLQLDLDLVFRHYEDDLFAILVYDGNDYQVLAWFSGADEGGPNFNNAIHHSFDLSPYRNDELHLAFLYDDSDNWNWWVGFDNVNILGWGEINDLCANAQPLTVNAPCVTASNINALFQGPQVSCANSSKAGIWFSFQAPASGQVTITTESDFNDVLTVFPNNCNTLNPIACVNKDEYGFQGEELKLAGLTPNATYLIRVSGEVAKFGVYAGTLCIKVSSGVIPTAAPNNDLCANATTLTLNAACTIGNNRRANMDGPLPTIERSLALFGVVQLCSTHGRQGENRNQRQLCRCDYRLFGQLQQPH